MCRWSSWWQCGQKTSEEAPAKKHRRLQMSLWDLFEVDLTAILGVGVETALLARSDAGHQYQRRAAPAGQWH